MKPGTRKLVGKMARLMDRRRYAYGAAIGGSLAIGGIRHVLDTRSKDLSRGASILREISAIKSSKGKVVLRNKKMFPKRYEAYQVINKGVSKGLKGARLARYVGKKLRHLEEPNKWKRAVGHAMPILGPSAVAVSTLGAGELRRYVKGNLLDRLEEWKQL